MAELTAEQYTTLAKAIKPHRIAKRSGGGGKQLSYLEAWEVRAHLIRIFGFGNFDAEVIQSDLVFQRDTTIGQEKKPGWEVAYQATVQLTIRDEHGDQLCRYTESAIGSESGSVGLGDLCDNALKTAASDALKRCAINLGNQFGLSLYQQGSTKDVVKGTLVKPVGVKDVDGDLTDEQAAAIQASLGAEIIDESTDSAPVAPPFEGADRS